MHRTCDEPRIRSRRWSPRRCKQPFFFGNSPIQIKPPLAHSPGQQFFRRVTPTGPLPSSSPSFAQATLQTNPSPDARLAERGVQSLADMYPEGSTAMCVSGTYYGQLVTVLAHQGERLVVAVPPPRNLQAVSQRILQASPLPRRGKYQHHIFA